MIGDDDDDDDDDDDGDNDDDDKHLDADCRHSLRIRKWVISLFGFVFR